MMQLYDFGVVKEFSRYLGQMHHENGTQREVWRYHDTNLVSLGQPLHFTDIAGRKSGSSDYHVNTMLSRRTHRRHGRLSYRKIYHHIRPATAEDVVQAGRKGHRA